MKFHRLAVLFTPLSLAALAANLELQSPRQMVVDQNGNATTDLTFCNNTKGPVRFNPVLTDFEHEFDGKKYPLGTATNWAQNPPEQLPKGCNTFKITISKIWDAGVSTAILRNGADSIPMVEPGREPKPESLLTAVRLPSTINVGIVAPNSNSAEIHFVGNRARVTLHNNDSFNYAFRWTLELDDLLIKGEPCERVVLNAGGTGYFYIPPENSKSRAVRYPSAGLWVSGTLKDEVRPARLILEPDFGPKFAQPPPVKEMAIAVRFSRWGATAQQFSNAFCILLLLLVGGVASIFINSGIPNYKGALALRRRLIDLEKTITGMDSSIESRWRVLLFSHVRALNEKLCGNRWWYPSFGPTLATFTQTGDMLRKWVDLTYAVALLMHNAECHLKSLPPTLLRRIEQRCERALNPIESGYTKDEEIVRMQAELEAAQNDLKSALSESRNPDFEKDIKEREKRLEPWLEELLKGADTVRYQQYEQQFGGVLAAADKAVNAVNKDGSQKELEVADYLRYDITLLKAELIKTYDERLRAVPAAQSRAVVGGNPIASLVIAKARARLEEQGKRLAEYLIPETHESLRLAMLFGEEMQQDFYPGPDSKMLTAVHANPPQLSIHHEPQNLTVNLPVRFCLLFEQATLNEAAARREWTCEWTFGTRDETETGWEVFRTFANPGAVNVKVRIKDLDGSLVAEILVPTELQVTSDRQRWQLVSREARLEATRLAIALLLALFGLMTLAQQKAQSLSFWEAIAAVIAVGFGADAIKNMIVRTDQPGRTT